MLRFYRKWKRLLSQLYKENKVVFIAIAIFVTGHILDSATTIIGLFYPPTGREFVEVGNVFIKFFIYDLQLGKAGFFTGDAITWAFELLYMYARALKPFQGIDFAEIITFLIFFGLVHWIAGLFNIFGLYF